MDHAFSSCLAFSAPIQHLLNYLVLSVLKLTLMVHLRLAIPPSDPGQTAGGAGQARGSRAEPGLSFHYLCFLFAKCRTAGGLSTLLGARGCQHWVACAKPFKAWQKCRDQKVSGAKEIWELTVPSEK